MTVLLRVLLFAVVIYFIIRWISKLFEPAETPKNHNRSGANENETTIRFNKNGKKIIDKDKGEYVDFEEVD
jgi:hypothetical protein